MNQRQNISTVGVAYPEALLIYVARKAGSLCHLFATAVSAGAALLISSAFAADLTPSALLVQDSIGVNRGQAMQMLVPANANTWTDSTPYLLPDSLEIVFRGNAKIQTVKFTVQFQPILAGQLQQWDGKQWADVAPLPVGVGDKQIKLDHVLETRAIRLLITQNAKTDHSPMVVRNFRIDGETVGATDADERANLDITCAAEFNTFDLPAPAQATIAVHNSGENARAYLLRYRWETIYGDAVASAEPQEQRLELKPGEQLKLPVTFGFKEQGPYRISADLVDAKTGTLVSRERLLIGMRGAFDVLKPSKPIPAAATGQSDFWWSAEISQSILGLKHPSSDLFFEKTRAAGGNMVNAFLNYCDFEPLPGVYNFQFFDTMVQQAQRYQLALAVGLWRWEFNEPAQYWMAQDILTDAAGKPGKGWEQIYSPWGATYRQHALAAVEAMVKRYQNCSEIKIWHPHPYGMVDHAAHSEMDYTQAGKQAYHRWLQERYNTLSALNHTYGTQYDAWDAVPIPTAQWRELKAAGDWTAATRVMDLRPAYVDYQQFWHQDSVVAFRNQLMETVRKYDPNRMFDGTSASAGKPAADAWWRGNQKYKAYAGDQGMNLGHYVRRMVSRRQYGLLQRYEDISPVSPDRFKTGLPERAEWNAFQSCFLGVEHFNYAFPTWDQSLFWDRFFANPRAKNLIEHATRAQLVSNPVGYLHSFATDNLEGCTEYDAVTLLRWWTMNGLSRAMVEPGYFFESLSTEGDLSRLDEMKLVIDDGSRLLSADVMDRLVRFVNAGGKLVLTLDSGQYTAEKPDARYELLQKLGYRITPELDQRISGPANAILTSYDPGATVAGSGDAASVFTKLKTLPLQYYAVLTPPTGGRVLGSIQGRPAVVAWNVGKGAVILLAGRVGSTLEATVQQAMSDPAAKGRAYPMWHDAEAEAGALYTALMQDLFAWANVKPGFTVDGTFVGTLKQSADTRLVYLFNMGDEQTPVIRLCDATLHGATLTLRLETLDASVDLGDVAGDQLVGSGLRLPALKGKSLAVISMARRK